VCRLYTTDQKLFVFLVLFTASFFVMIEVPLLAVAEFAIWIILNIDRLVRGLLLSIATFS
jgi:hypothetical protein